MPGEPNDESPGATGYVTEAESFGFAAVFHLVLAADPEDLLGCPPQAPWWVGVKGADWQHPEGRHSGITERGDHPVVHVSWNDAKAYCAWAGRGLPTEVQWGFSSRGGLSGARYPWGDELIGADGSWRVSIWQGTFPTENTQDDGFLTTAPVRSYRQRADIGVVRDPAGSGSGQSRVMRGGSYLCHDSYCNRYPTTARSSNTPDSSMGNAGFRTVLQPRPIPGQPAS